MAPRGTVHALVLLVSTLFFETLLGFGGMTEEWWRSAGSSSPSAALSTPSDPAWSEGDTPRQYCGDEDTGEAGDEGERDDDQDPPVTFSPSHLAVLPARAADRRIARTMQNARPPPDLDLPDKPPQPLRDAV